MLRKWLCGWRCKNSVYKSLTSPYRDELLNLCWYCWGGGLLPFRLLCCRVPSENNWRLASGHGQYRSSARDLIYYFNNKWLLAIPISSVFKICINEIGTYSVFSWLQVIIGFLRLLWGWKLFWTRKHKNSVGDFLAKVCFIKHRLQAEILQNSQEVEFMNQDNRQTYYKILKQHGCCITQHILRNMNQLRMSLGRIRKSSASLGGTEKIVWRRWSYQVPSMVGTDASTNENHKLYNSTVQAI